MVCSFQGAFTSTSVLHEAKSPDKRERKASGLGGNRKKRKAVGGSKKFKAENWWTRG
jgi:hypothetical protein